MKKCIAMLLVLLMICSLCPAMADDAPVRVGIIQLVQHPALDAATQGFMDRLTELAGEDTVVFDYQKAQGDSNICATIVNGFVADKVDLIMANATAALQAAFNGTMTIPVLGTSITDYASALELTDFEGVTGMNVSGTSDLAPLDQQAQMILDLLPEAKVVGLIYCTAEANSLYQINIVKAYLEDKGLEAIPYGFSDSNDLAAVVTAACEKCDALYVPTDNTCADNTEVINNIALPAGIPIIAGEEGICAGCGLATLSISYYDIGAVTGEMAYQILFEGADITQMAIQYAPQVTRKYNADIAQELGIDIPEEYEAIG